MNDSHPDALKGQEGSTQHQSIDTDLRWIVLSDNRCDGAALMTEHGLSILLLTARHKILLDTGASDVFVRNADALGLDLSDVDYVFISHGHSDHAGSLRYLMERAPQAKVIVSPHAMTGKFYSNRGRLHSITADWPVIAADRLIPVDKTCQITDGIHVIAHIPHVHPMPRGNQHLYVEDADGNHVNDDFRHEMAFYSDGFLFTGCAHSGLENILAACPWPVHTIVGGFHLLDGLQTEDELKALAQRLKEQYPETQFFTSHCTGDEVFKQMKTVMGDQLHAFHLGTASK